MKKLLLAVSFLFIFVNNVFAGTITYDSLVSADDVTIAWLNGFKNTVVDALNSFPGDNIQADSITVSAFDDNTNIVTRWDESFGDYVYSGLLPPTSTDLTSITTAGTAYIYGTRVAKTATSHTYTASKDTYVDLSSTGTYTYSEVVNGGTAPATASNSIRLAKVVTDATKVASVTDMRTLGVQLSTNEDFYKSGLGMIYHTTEEISVDTGVVYNGSTRIEKVAVSALDITSASDYVSGVSENGATKALYIYVSPTGSFKLDDNAPTYHDTDGNTAGTLNYLKSGSDYYKLIGLVSTDASSQVNKDNLTSVEMSGKVVQVLNKQRHDKVNLNVAIPQDGSLPQITEGVEIFSLAFIPTNTKNKVRIDVNTTGGATSEPLIVALFKKGESGALAATASYGSDAGFAAYNQSDIVYFITEDAAVATYVVRAGAPSGTAYLNANTSGNALLGGAETSSITITEYTP